jgi:hypothetical protein
MGAPSSQHDAIEPVPQRACRTHFPADNANLLAVLAAVHAKEGPAVRGRAEPRLRRLEQFILCGDRDHVRIPCRDPHADFLALEYRQLLAQPGENLVARCVRQAGDQGMDFIHHCRGGIAVHEVCVLGGYFYA